MRGAENLNSLLKSKLAFEYETIKKLIELHTSLITEISTGIATGPLCPTFYIHVINDLIIPNNRCTMDFFMFSIIDT